MAAPSLVTATPCLVTEDGSRVSAETSSRLSCDAEVVPITRGRDRSVLDVGRGDGPGERIDWGWAMACLWGDGGGQGVGARAGGLGR